jgi:exodeoxyribonuclease VII large subunit
MNSETKEKHIYTVAELNKYIRVILEDSFPAVWVEGELSNFIQHTSGHMYFTLKDAQAQIRGVMFRGNNRLLKFQPTDGLAVLVCGTLTVYERRGEYQLNVEFMEPKGVGALQLAFLSTPGRLAGTQRDRPAVGQPVQGVDELLGALQGEAGDQDLPLASQRRAHGPRRHRRVAGLGRW